MSDSLIGRQLGNFEVKSVLGHGGMATVYRAYQQTVKRDVAIKVMKRELSDDEEFIHRFEREAKIFAELQHPHILGVIEFGRTDDGWIYIVFQLADGGGLDKQIRRQGAIPLKTTAKMLTQVGSALSFAHRKDIVHRDIKTSNILLDHNENAYLTDFGIAKMLASSTRLTTTSHIMGTPAYMSPEQWRAEKVDARSDIYSLGIIAYEMVSGDLPFLADTAFSLMHLHVNQPPPSLAEKDIPEAVELVILRAVAKDPASRFQIADDFAQAFTDAVNNPLNTYMLSLKKPAESSLPHIEIEIDAASPKSEATITDAPQLNLQRSTLPNQANETEPVPLTRVHVRDGLNTNLIVLIVALAAVVLAALAIVLVTLDNRNNNENNGSQIVAPTATVNPTSTFEPPPLDSIPLSAAQPMFEALGIEFSGYPQTWSLWTASQVDSGVHLHPDSRFMFANTEIEIRRVSKEAIRNERGITVDAEPTLEMIGRALLVRAGARPDSIEITNPPMQIEYPASLFLTEIDDQFHYLVLVELPEGNLLIFSLINDGTATNRVRLEELLVRAILHSLSVDNVALAPVGPPGPRDNDGPPGEPPQ